MAPFEPLCSETAIRRPAILLVVLLAVVIAGEIALPSAFSSIGTAGIPDWLPQVGTPGTTVLFYIRLMDALKYVLVPLTALWLAYACGRHRASN